jgi:thiazole synthase
MEEILASASELVTVALKRIDLETETDAILKFTTFTHQSMPNTSELEIKKLFLLLNLPEALETNWLKLEIHPDPKYLMPDAIETLRATEELAKLGFIVLPTFMLILFCASD